MPTLNFKKQFIPVIQNGNKTQTLREIGKRKYKVGQTLYLYTGQRTKACQKIAEAICTEIGDIELTEEGEILLNGKLTSPLDMALADGFVSTSEFFHFFSPLPKKLRIIKWRLKK